MTSKRVHMLLYMAASVAATHPVRAEIVVLDVRVVPQCAGTPSTGGGSGLLRLDTETGIMSYNIGFSTDFTVVFSHIHGPIDQGCGTGGGGGFMYTFLAPESPFVGTTEAQLILNAEQIRGLIAGKYYVNIHTTNYFDGEISGHINLSRKNRYVTWHPSLVDDPRLTNGDTLGLRVTIVSLPEFPAAEGRTLWAGPPDAFPEEDTSAPGLTFSGAMLQCASHLQDWSTLGSLHITGGEVIPNATYQFDLYDPACGDEDNPACFFGTRVVQTAKFGDVAAPFSVPGVAEPDFKDISAQVQKFLADPRAPIKAAAHLVPNTPKSTNPVDFKTIAATVNGFVGVLYSDLAGITGPCACPSVVPCGTGCAIDLDCGTGLCIAEQCTDPCGRCVAL